MFFFLGLTGNSEFGGDILSTVILCDKKLLFGIPNIAVIINTC